MSRVLAGVAVALCLLVVPVVAGGQGSARPAVQAANCTGPVPPGAEINRCNALRARSELSRP
jgi:hypothetical protein